MLSVYSSKDWCKHIVNYTAYQDNELMLLLSEGSHAAYTEIYNRYWKLLYAIAYKHAKNTASAEDIVHEVFASLWKNRQHIQVISLENYLAAAVKYTVFAHIRKYSCKKVFGEANVSAVDASNLEDDYFYKEMLAFAHSEIELLPPRCQLVFKYSRELGMSNGEIANLMATSKKTVENQLNKALNHLRFSLKRILLFFL